MRENAVRDEMQDKTQDAVQGAVEGEAREQTWGNAQAQAQTQDKTQGDNPLAMKVAIAISFVAMIVVNALAAPGILGFAPTAVVSESFPTQFTPSGMTFSIWSLIYLGIGLYTLYQFGLFRAKASSETDERMQGTIAWPFLLLNLANLLWMLAWGYLLLGLSTVLIIFMLLMLININIIIYRAEKSRAEKNGHGLSTRDRLLVRLPFGLYFGWITVATIANIAVFLVALGVPPFTPLATMVTCCVLAVSAIIGVAVTWRLRCVAYGLVFIWAYIGILVEQMSLHGYAGAWPAIIATLLCCMVAVVATLIMVLWQMNAGGPRRPA